MSEPGGGRRMRAGRGLAVPAAGLTALLAVVALASAARIGSGGGDGLRLSLPEGFYAWFYAVFLVAGALAFPIFLYISTRTSQYDRTARRRGWLAPVWLVAGIGLLVLVRTIAGDGFGGVLDRLSIGADPPDLPAGPRGGAPPAPEAVPLATVLAVMVAGVGAFFAHRLLRRRRGSLSSRVTGDLSSVLDETLDDLRAEPDVRRAIVRAYARMERVLERSGVRREDSEAPLEYLTRVLLELDVRPQPVHALTELFERARFSTHQLGADAKEAAIGALEGVRDDLEAAAAEAVPAPA